MSSAGPGDGGNADSPVSQTPNPSEPPGSPNPLPVKPRDGLVDVRAQSWVDARAIDDRTLDVTFYGGVEECEGLDHVAVRYGTNRVVLTIFTGRVPTADVCIELAQLKSTSVDLSEPLAGRKIVDGAPDQG